MLRLRFLLILAVLSPAAQSYAQTSQACDGLKSLALTNASVTTAAVVSGSFTPPGATNPNATIGNLPAFCRVAIVLRPTSDSEINTEIWLPVSGWNRKLQSVGNGAWAGVIPYGAMAAAITSGYGTAGTDTGHVGNTAGFVPGHPERLVDYGWKQWVEKGEAPKQIIAEHSANGVADRRRPVCPHPQVAVYSGKGSLDDAASFTCKVP